MTAAIVLVAASVAVVQAVGEMHAVGEAWVHRDAPDGTWVHHPEDEQCFVGFEAECYGGMMAPDSVLCEFGPLDPTDWPEDCVQGVVCDVTDPDGTRMFDGHGMNGGMMRREVDIQVHYRPDDVAAMGIDPGSLCLVRIDGSSRELCEGAIHDPGAGTFSWSTSAPAGTYVVLPRSAIVPNRTTGVGVLKAAY